MFKDEYDEQGFPTHPWKRFKCKMYYVRHRIKLILIRPFKHIITVYASQSNRSLRDQIMWLHERIKKLEENK